MLYNETTRKAMKIAFDAHKNQVDEYGTPYIYYIMDIVERQVQYTRMVCIALLHKVIEHGKYTISGLENAGFEKEIIDSVKLLTKDTETDYFDYIKTISQSREDVEAWAVAKSILEYHRSNAQCESDIKKYEKALEILNQRPSLNEKISYKESLIFPSQKKVDFSNNSKTINNDSYEL